MNTDILYQQTNINDLIKAFRSLQKPTYNSILKPGKSILADHGLSDLKERGALTTKAIQDEIMTNKTILSGLNILCENSEQVKEYLKKIASLVNEDGVKIYFSLPKNPSSSPYNVRKFVLDEINSIKKKAYQKLGVEIFVALFDFIHNQSRMNDYDAQEKAEEGKLSKAAELLIHRQKVGDYQGEEGVIKLREHIAEFYKMINFREKKIDLDLLKGRASFYPQTRVLNIGKELTRSTLYHELAHSIECDHPQAIEMSKAFLLKRLENSNGIKSLRAIYKSWGDTNNKFPTKEIAVDDHTFSPYVAKFYTENNWFTDPKDLTKAEATEVISMGFECFATSADMGKMATADLEHLEFMLSILKLTREKGSKK